MSRAVVAAWLLTLAAAGTVGLAAREWISPGTAPSTGEVCSAAADVLTALGGSVNDQVALRARAVHLADTLIDRAGQTEDAASLDAARRVLAVLDDPDATVSDLARVVTPVAEKCSDLGATR